MVQNQALSSSAFLSLLERKIAALEKGINTGGSTNVATGAIGFGTDTPSTKLQVKNSTTLKGSGVVSITTGSDTNTVDIVTLRADVGDDLNNKFWILHSARGTKIYSIWYNVSSKGTDPFPSGSLLNGLRSVISVEVAVTSNATAIAVATATAAAINALDEFTCPNSGASTITITHVISGFSTIPSDETVGGTWATIRNTTGVSAWDVIGIGTTFVYTPTSTSGFSDGDPIKIGGYTYTVSKVLDDTHLVLNSAAPASLTNVKFYSDIPLFSLQTSDCVEKLHVTKSGRVGIGRVPINGALEVSGSGSTASLILVDEDAEAANETNAAVYFASTNYDIAGAVGFSGQSPGTMYLQNFDGDLSLASSNHIIVPNLIGTKYDDDTAAATAGVPIGGLYVANGSGALADNTLTVRQS